MAWKDRPYYRDDRPHIGGFSRYSANTWLIIINVAVFFIGAILTNSMRGDFLSPYRWGYFSLDTAVLGGQVWRWVTFQFLHAGIFHLFFNMLFLYFFGPMLEAWWGRTRYVVYYLLSGMGGALLFLLMAMVPGLLGVSPERAALIGASGGVFGVLAGCAVIAPKQPVRLLLLPVEMTMRTLVLIVLGIAAISVIFGASNAGGDAAHLGGALVGFLLVKKPRIISWLNLRGLRSWRDANRWQRQQRKLAEEEAEIGRILAKVKEHGLHSLTRAEKKMLQRETDRLRSAG